MSNIDANVSSHIQIGASRKAFLGTLCQKDNPKDRAWGTAATVSAAVCGGADIVRVHDVIEMIDVAKVSDAIWRQALPPPNPPASANDAIEE